MDNRRPSVFPFSHDPGGRVGIDAAPNVRRFTDLKHKPVLPASDQAERMPANPLREDLFVVYSGNARRVSEGFAIALGVMGVEGHVGLPTTNQNMEDN
jgi:hypothetical protein